MKEKSIERYSPDTVIEQVISYFFPEEWKIDIKRTFATIFITAFLCYFMLMVTGYAGPDAIVEGVNMYQGFDWAVSMGRWALAYMQRYAFGNAVVPFLIVMLYTFFIACSMVFIFRMINIRNAFGQIILSVLFISFPVVLYQFEFLYMAVYYAISFFCAVAGVFLIRQRKVWGYVLATVLFLLMLGAYQAYIGAVAALSVILFIFDMVDGKKKAESFFTLLLTALCGLIAAGADLLVVNATMKAEGLQGMDKVSGFSLTDIIENIGFSFQYSMKWFFDFFKDGIFSRNVLYIIIIAATAIGLLLAIVQFVRKKKIAEALLTLLMIFLLSHAMNITLYLFPHNGITEIMQYQYALVFVMLIGIIERCTFPIPQCILKWISYCVLFVLACTFIISDNIAGVVMKVIYTENHTEATAMLNRVYELEGYKKGETKVILADSIGWQSTYNEFEMLRAETEIGVGPVFWSGDLGLNICRRNYFMNYLGIEVGYITMGEYEYVTQSDKFADMPVWPAEGSVAMIDGYAVIKNQW